MKKRIILAMICFASFSAISVGAEEDPEHFAKHIDDNYAKIRKQVCEQLDLNVNVKAGPFFYTDPNASCDLGFQMPGLPDFNLGFDGLDSCKLLKAVTGELVDKLNSQVKDALDKGLEGAGVEDGTDIDIDFGDIVIDEVGKN